MSADSPKLSHIRQSKGPCIVTPQEVTDPTILESVAGFINEVVPTTNNVPIDPRDQIQWVQFGKLDEEEIDLWNLDAEKHIPSPLILILGYASGLQVWSVAANGDATEIISWKHGYTRVFKFIPTPFKVDGSNIDQFRVKRPLIALCDNVSPGHQYNAVSFLSLKTGEQVKLIKFKSAVLDILANKRSIVVSFVEKLAILDAFTLEDRYTISTCYLSSGVNANPVALGPRWIAFAEKSLNALRKSCGGNESEGVQSYTATVLQAAKSLSKGLKEIGESFASSLTGSSHLKSGTSPGSPQAGGPNDSMQKGIVTILDIGSKEIDNPESKQPVSTIAHFLAHNQAIVCLAFDPSGTLLLTADKRGHDFHVFRIQPHPINPALTAVHHLYILHRGDTTAKVQDMSFSLDSRWVSVSTLRGTTHVFPITMYGGNVGVRTHTTQHVVNKMSRYHRSAGLTGDGRSNSPVSSVDASSGLYYPYHNPRFPPFPRPTIVNALAQIRQPIMSQNQAAQQRSTSRQLLSSSLDDNMSLRVATCFALNRAYLETQSSSQDTSAKKTKTIESLFAISCHGNLVQYDLEPRPVSSVPREKVCDDTPIELRVLARAQWGLARDPHAADVPLPLSNEQLEPFNRQHSLRKRSWSDQDEDLWLSQVEILTHSGPHRRLWMGPQFTFKKYTTGPGSPFSMTEVQQLDISRSKPVNMPVTKSNIVVIESGSANSNEYPIDTYQVSSTDELSRIGDMQLREDLADAMLESPGVRETGGRCIIVTMKPHSTTVAKVVNPLGTVVTVQSDEESLETEPLEEVIHENCDEALFRPIVVPKPVLYTERKLKQHPADPMFIKSLDNTTGMAVEILNSGRETKAKKVKNNKKKKSDEAIDVEKIIAPFENKFNEEPLILIPDLPPIPKDDYYEESKIDPKDDSDFASLESTKYDIDLKIDMFEDASDCCDNLIYINSEESVPEEKDEIITRKLRKPKAKLGVRISNKLALNEEEKVWSKRSWSSVCATKPKEKENDLLEMLNEDLIGLKESAKPVDDSLHLDVKSSDDEKIDSSPADTTESEGLPDVGVNEVEDIQGEIWTGNKTVQVAKTTKKKSKKKRK